MIVLDTNVISSMMQATPQQAVKTWLDSQLASSVWTTAVTVFEVRSGLAVMALGKRQRALQEAFEKALNEDLEDRVLAFDAAAATQAAAITAKLRAAGRPVEIRDVMIAGIVAVNRATLATRNIKHFVDTGVALVDPWQSGPP